MVKQETIILKPSGKVYLDLPGNRYKSKRFIGCVSGDTFHTERNSRKHLLRINQSLGFNYELIKNGNFDFICVTYDFERLWTSRQVILNEGEFFHFSKGSLELQIFLKLDDFKSGREEAVEELKELESKKLKETKLLNYQLF